jgi:hypothetical protein
VLALKRSNINPRYVYITAPSYAVLQERLENRIAQQRQAMKDAAKAQNATGRRQIRHIDHNTSRQDLRNESPAMTRASTSNAILADMPRHKHTTKHTMVRDWSSGSINSSTDGNISDATDSEADGLVSQWLDKAQRDTKQHTVGNQEVLFAEFMSEPGFFDAVIVNDDLDPAYNELKEFVMKYYWETYDDDNSQE